MADGTLARIVARDVAAMQRDGSYRSPDAGELAAVPALAAALAVGDADGARRVGASLGLETHAPGRGVLLLRSVPGDARTWLTVVMRVGVPVDLLVEVPHPNADLHTDQIGLAVRARCPGALYVQAGAHRVAGGPGNGSPDRSLYPADVAARADTVFARLAEALLPRPQIQLHGFADRPASGVDVVLSSGACRPGPLLTTLAVALRDAGERVGVGDDPRWTDLLGRRNVQGRAAACHDAAFVHVELSRALRRDPDRRARVADAIARAMERHLPAR